MEPILRWAGGKIKLISRLVDFVPADYSHRTYREPFFGAGSMFFSLQPPKAVLSDANPHLISCHEHIRDDWENVNRHLRKHARTATKKHYYETRELYNNAKPSAAQAARFIFLNKTCFNGIFRVNAKGIFNVPYGWKRPPALPRSEKLRLASEALAEAKLRALSYEDALAGAKSGDFIYLDPPYPPLNGTAYFTHYTTEKFSLEDHKKLAKQVRKLDKMGCLVMMSNADTPLIRRLYAGFQVVSLPVTRYLSCKAIRRKVKEVVITNYPLGSEKKTNKRAASPKTKADKLHS
jgi:DNA adenine methylase